VQHFSWGYYPLGYRYNVVWVAVFAGLFIVATRIMTGAATSEETESKERAAALVRAFAVGSLAFVDFLPTIGFPAYPLGFVAIPACTGVAAASILRSQRRALSD